MIERLWWDSGMRRWRWLYRTGDIVRQGHERSRECAEQELMIARSRGLRVRPELPVALPARWQGDTGRWTDLPPGLRPHLGPIDER